MELKTFFAQYDSGGIVYVLPGAKIDVYDAGTTTPTEKTIYDKNNSPITNPLTATGTGLVQFAMEDGAQVDVKVTGQGRSFVVRLGFLDQVQAKADIDLAHSETLAASAVAQAASNASGVKWWYAAKADFLAALTGLADGVYGVALDESHNGMRTRYSVASHVATYQLTENAADEIGIVDTAGHYISKKVEGALQEIGQNTADLASSADDAKGGAKVGYYDRFAPLFLKTVSDMLSNAPISPLSFIDKTRWSAIRNGSNTTDLAGGLQTWLTACDIEGGEPRFTPGLYLSRSPLVIPDNTTIDGPGAARAVLETDLDIEQLVSARTANANAAYITLKHFQVRDRRVLDKDGTVTRTNFQIRITNGIGCELEKIVTSCNLEDQTHPVLTNIGGIFFEKYGDSPDLHTYINQLNKCWVRNGVARIDSTDSEINGGFYWGFCCPYAIRIGGGNLIMRGVNFIPSPVNGGVYSPVAGDSESLKMSTCFSDGSNVPGVVTGPAIYGALSAAKIEICDFWYSYTNAIKLFQAEGCSFVGNSFDNNNRAMAGHADILLQPTAGLFCRSNVFTGNNFKNGIVTAGTKGKIFKEDTSLAADSCYRNVFTPNVVHADSGGYATPLIEANRAHAAGYERTIIGPNANANTYTSGTTQIASGASSITVNHNLGIAPFMHEIDVKPNNSAIGTHVWRIANITTTAFDIILDSNAGANTGFNWSVKLSA